MGIEHTVADRVRISDELRTGTITHTAHFEVDDEIPRPDDSMPEPGEEPQFLAELHVSKYLVTYAHATVHDAQGSIVKMSDELRIEYPHADLNARPIFKLITVNKSRYIPANTFQVVNAKVIEPPGRTFIAVGELDDLVVAGLRKISSPEIQDALGSYIHGYAQNRDVRPEKE